MGSFRGFSTASVSYKAFGYWKALERATIGGDSPVQENLMSHEGHPSTAGHVKSGGNLGGPSSKAKYYSMTDSEQVP